MEDGSGRLSVKSLTLDFKNKLTLLGWEEAFWKTFMNLLQFNLQGNNFDLFLFPFAQFPQQGPFVSFIAQISKQCPPVCCIPALNAAFSAAELTLF